MKLSIAILAVLITGFSAHAAVRTVSNNPINAGQYTTLLAAYSSAAPGDTIYLQGSVVSYGDLLIKKRVTLIGAGYKDSSINLTSTVDNLTIDSSSSGTKILGLNINFILNTSSYHTDSVYIGRCYCLHYISITGNYWLIENCIITGGSGCIYCPYEHSAIITYTPNINCIIRNNIISLLIDAAGPASNLIVDHNILSWGVQSDYGYFSNNIFFGDNNPCGGSSHGIFNNNLLTCSSFISYPSGTDYGSSNLEAVWPSYQFYNTLTSWVEFPASVSYNWHLLPTSIGHNAATDGTDMGIYGGVSPMPNFTGATTIPQMTLMNISNLNIALDSPLHIHFKARKQN